MGIALNRSVLVPAGRMARALLLLSLVVLAGCAAKSVDTGEPVSEALKEQRWQLHRDHLEQLQHWQLTGRLNLRVPGESGTMSIDWQQQLQQYSLLLDGPLGTSIARITGSDHGVSVTVSGETLHGSSPEELLHTLTGWQFPVSYLKYWVVGLPAPDGDARIVLDNQGYPERIEQSGWEIAYQKHSAAAGFHLPTRLTIRSGDVRLGLLVSNWQL